MGFRRPQIGGNEASVVRAAQSGSEEALATLFRRHWPMAHRAAYLVVRDESAAEDIAQEAFLSAIRALGRFDRRRPFGPWLHRIVVNRAIDWSRARTLRREVSATPERRREVSATPERRREVSATPEPAGIHPSPPAETLYSDELEAVPLPAWPPKAAP